MGFFDSVVAKVAKEVVDLLKGVAKEVKDLKDQQDRIEDKLDQLLAR